MSLKADYECDSIHFGEFKDKGLEHEFLNHEISNAIKYIKPLLLVLAILYFSFIIPDYYIIKDNTIFKKILINRSVISLLIIILYFRIRYLRNYIAITYWFTIYEIIVSLSFLTIFYQYESPDFLIQSLGVIIIIFSIFLVPNKWKYMIFTSACVSIGFFGLSLYFLKNIKMAEFSAGVVHILLIILLIGISSYRINYYKRAQYLNSKKLIKMSVTDGLTGIYNRSKFDNELEKWVEVSRRYNTNLSLVIYDIDNFKTINDSYGHLVGDKVLVDIVKIVMKVIRKTDVFARWGGEEFTILLPNTEIDQAVDISRRLRRMISEYQFDEVGKVTCSFGVSYLKKNDDIETFLHRADQRLYLAKSIGKNTVISQIKEA